MLYRLQRALRERVRYRYVRPQILREGKNLRIQSPCCSRNVDPDGGLIDIALLVSNSSDNPDNPDNPNSWSLCSRDHTHQTWVVQLRDQPLDVLLDALCMDDARQFWP
ncbi:MAG: hypothetical protein IPH35_17815 [Rhodoferax sp.]|nr:hypothetical protein [Rhodoferax sp.]